MKRLKSYVKVCSVEIVMLYWCIEYYYIGSQLHQSRSATYRPQFVSCLRQCRINNSSKCSNCCIPRAFGGPAVLVLNLFFITCNIRM